ncbi:outer membrane protein [Polyangium jinanense]|uniref:Outer membrane protein beta-barrel domain-containing protein n=1 Tax=Polyangium jinanense TaxID=2829994 RepID=A0A9X3WY90_9BACT|nr:hypothetical protein [Polyangium jinanense]MDC3952678.1 hypothetical protein [Polyangium jinanense]MDC3980297.1 hypothetical protein [Polyangium jinanense]
MFPLSLKAQKARAFGAAALLVSLLGAEQARAQAAPPAQPKKPRQTGVDLSASVGGAVRLGDAPLFPVAQRGGGMFGFGLAYLLHPIWIGLTYEHVGLGREESGVVPFGAVHIARSTDTVWASLRVRLSGLEPVVPFFGAGLGAVWQSAHADGVVLVDGGLRGGQPFSCSARDSLNLGMRVGAGVEVPIGKTVSFTGEGSFDAYRLSSEVIEGCAPGAGTTNSLLFRVGLLYRFDLTEGRDKPLPPTSARHVR